MTHIGVLAELDRNGIGYDFSGEDEVAVCCPFHDDKSPSCSVNVQTGLFKCQTSDCGAKGDFVKFLAGVLRVDRVTVLTDLGSRYELGDADKTVEAEVIERHHAAVWEAKPLLKALRVRGVTDDLIRKYRIGFNRGRLTIPIKNEGGLYVNERRYLPGAPGKEKMRNMRGRGKLRLFPVEQLKYESIMVCSGELKAIVAADQLNEHGVGAISCTGGESNWDASFTHLLRDKTVYVCYDVDEAGRKGARAVLTYVSRVADWTGDVVLPLDVDAYPHGDINDFCGPAVDGDLWPLVQACEEWTPPVDTGLGDEEPVLVELSTATNAKFARKRIQIKCVITATDRASYTIPRETQVMCDRSQNECAACAVYMKDEGALHTVDPESEAILAMVGSTKAAQREALMSAVGVPHSCRVCQFHPTAFYNVEDVRVSEQLAITSRSNERTMQPAVCIGDDVRLNESYLMTGRMHPHPRTQESTLVISAMTPTEDALGNYVAENLEELEIFRPDEWTVSGIEKKLDELYDDLEANCTRIFQRRDVHVAIDLAFHSPLVITFDDKKDVKGWVEVLIVGDSSQGKTETYHGLSQHYGLGERVECENATLAGLLGGLQQMGSKWFVTWGVIPTQDRRLVCLEEFKGAAPELISKLKDMRSSGVAEIPKIERRKTNARTRLVALSNPRTSRPIASYNFGIEALHEMTGGLEDLRRFDFCVLLSEGDIDHAELNRLRRDRPTVEHQYVASMCRSLVLWSWTRSQEEVHFEETATSEILDSSVRLSDKYVERIPIVDKGGVRYKIARLSAALAARTFSTDDTGTVLVVRRAHVEYVVAFMDRTYSSDVFGYEDYSKAIQITETLTDPGEVEKIIKTVPWPRDFIEAILTRSYIEGGDIADWTGWDRHESHQLLSFLVRKRALQRSNSRAYRKTQQFIVLLKRMQQGELPNRPAFIEEEF